MPTLSFLGEAVIKDVEKLGENAPSKQEKEEEGIQDVSVDELEVEDSIMEQVNGDVSENEEGAKSNGDDLKESCVVSKESKPFCDEGEIGESLKRGMMKESESEAISCIQEKESWLVLCSGGLGVKWVHLKYPRSQVPDVWSILAKFLS